MSYYKNLSEYLDLLREKGKLVTINSLINKDTELHPLVRLQFRGLPEKQRKAFLFTNITDSKSKRYDMPLVVGCMAGSTEIYALGMQCEVNEIAAKWETGQINPIKPVEVADAPVQENVLSGAELERKGGLGILPIPISTPGFDAAPYTTASHFITKDIDTGVQNLGNYRGQLKSPMRLGCFASPRQHAMLHWQKYQERGVSMEAAVVIGVTPNIAYTSVAKIPEGIDELAVAGGIAGEPVEVVKCKTVDLYVPAHAEIVIEGIIPVNEVEHEAPFGEFTGYMAPEGLAKFMNVTCITYRNNPTYLAFLSQFPPSESSKIRQVAWERVVSKTLKVDCGFKSVIDVAMHESTGSWGLCVIRTSKHEDRDPQKILEVFRQRLRVGKVVVIVDEDINPWDADAVNWAICFNVQPHRDVMIAEVPGVMVLDPSIISPWLRHDPAGKEVNEASVLLIDATRKWSYPPTSLPKEKYMRRAIEIWEKEGLGNLNLREPWFGYDLGYWTEKDEEKAVLAAKGDCYTTGTKQELNRIPTK